MIIRWIGHSMFLLSSDGGARVVTDPFTPGCFDGSIAYDSTGISADIVTVSHSHDDHNASWSVGGNPKVFDKPGTFEHKGILIRGVGSFHDESQGSKRGKNTIFVIAIDGLRIAHLGDLGHALDPARIREIGGADVALAPFGGFFTIDGKQAIAAGRSLGARIVIPMHYKTAKVKLPIKPAEDYLASDVPVKRTGNAEVEVHAGGLPDAPEVWVLGFSG